MVDARKCFLENHFSEIAVLTACRCVQISELGLSLGRKNSVAAARAF